MTPRERVLAALDFKSPDLPPVEYHDSPGGLHEHGEKLKALWRTYLQDFNEYRDLPVPQPPAGAVDASGRYHEVRRDAWGTLWEYLIFGIAGHPLERPLDDWANLSSYKPPQASIASGEQFEAYRRGKTRLTRSYFIKSGWINLFEVMCSVRRFEDVLMDLASGEPAICRLADIISDYQMKQLDYLLAGGADAIQVADDWGTQTELLISPKLWREFFAPYYRRFTERIHQAGRKAFFHCCGYIWDLLDDLVEVGVDAVWPQLQLYDAKELSAKCRDLGLAVAIHPDRSHLMTTGTPDQICRSVFQLAKDFRIGKGGSWFYVEIDTGFPWPNVQALIESVAELRGMKKA
ncbi:MAG: hypothetical protein HZA50_15665 [Planctomycetes bacterium]|nr:hypothetical protein [Planctomycetota bacterium]